jgi:hypothetical protein
MATVKSDKLIVKDTNRDFTYTYTLEEKNNIQYISCAYSGREKKTGDFVAFELVDAIYKLNLGDKDLSKYYNLESFKESTIELGAQYQGDDKNGAIFINIKGDIFAQMSGKIQTLQQKAVITPNEMADIFTKLETDKVYEYEKDNTKIYVQNTTNNYEIYVSFEDDYVLNHSLANVIGILKPEVYDSLFNDNGEIEFQFNSPAYKLYTNVRFTEGNIFKNPTGLYHVRLHK